MARKYTRDEIRDMAAEIMESLRPRHMTVFQIKQLAHELEAMTENIVLRETAKEE